MIGIVGRRIAGGGGVVVGRGICDAFLMLDFSGRSRHDAVQLNLTSTQASKQASQSQPCPVSHERRDLFTTSAAHTQKRVRVLVCWVGRESDKRQGDEYTSWPVYTTLNDLREFDGRGNLEEDGSTLGLSKARLAVQVALHGIIHALVSLTDTRNPTLPSYLDTYCSNQAPCLLYNESIEPLAFNGSSPSQHLLVSVLRVAAIDRESLASR